MADGTYARECIAVNGYLIKPGAPVTVVHFLIIVVLRYTGGRGYITCSGYLFNDLIDETVTMLRGGYL